MKLIRRLEDFPQELRGGALTIGNFDGVHQGHRLIVSRLRALADRAQGPAVVFTFDPHPALLLRPDEAPPPLTWIDRKAELLDELGVDVILACPTTEELLRLSWLEFFDEVVCNVIGAAAMIEGSNFRFGRDRIGDVQLLAGRCAELSMEFETVQVIGENAQSVSSSRIRRLIREGAVAEASQLLTQPYRIRGMVVHGHARGARMGFPTANLDGIDTLVPGAGIYAGSAIVDGQAWPAAIHVGPVPTFGDDVFKVEVHLLDFTGSLYGRVIEVDFWKRLREIVHFTNPEDLLTQLHRDVADTRAVWDAATLRPSPGLL